MIDTPPMAPERIDASVLEMFAAPHDDSDAAIKVTSWRAASEHRLYAIAAADSARVAEPMMVHQRLAEGLPGRALLQSASLVYDTLEEITRFFDTTPKTLRARVRGERLPVDESERAMRLARVTLTAAQMLGGFDAARRYLHTRNFALGGAAPLDLLQTSQGEGIVLNELQAHAEDGPL